MKLPQWSPMVVAVLMGWVYVGLAAVLISVLSDTRQAEALSASVAMMGAAIGWLLGVALSPYTRKEESSFTKYGAAVAAFGSGLPCRPYRRSRETNTLFGPHGGDWLSRRVVRYRSAGVDAGHSRKSELCDQSAGEKAGLI
jgi:hypothetical protein